MVFNYHVDVGRILFDEIVDHVRKRSRCIYVPHLIHRLCLEAGCEESKADTFAKQPPALQPGKDRPKQKSTSTLTSKASNVSSGCYSRVETMLLSIAHSIRDMFGHIQASQMEILENQTALSEGKKVPLFNAEKLPVFKFEEDIEKGIQEAVLDRFMDEEVESEEEEDGSEEESSASNDGEDGDGDNDGSSSSDEATRTASGGDE